MESFVTYENYRNPHVGVHRSGCGHIGKNGGKDKYGNAKYETHETFIAAMLYAERLPLALKICGSCRPSESMSGLLDAIAGNIADEVAFGSALVEGARQAVMVNKYERNRLARLECIKAHGCSCIVCGFNFKEVYGELANGFIHVHHLVALCNIGIEHEVDPIRDLRPVCANCHAIIHLGRQHRSLDEVKALLLGARRGVK